MPELSTEEIFRIISSAKTAGVTHISFTGGDVFLRADALEIIQYAWKLGFTTSVVTSGTSFTEDIAKKLKKTRTFIYLSVEASKREVHERIRGKGSWDILLNAVENIKKEDLKFSTVMTLTRQNYTEIAGYISLSKRLGAVRACIIPAMQQGRAEAELILNGYEIVKSLKEIENAARSLKHYVSLWCIPFAPLVINSKWVGNNFCRLSRDIDIDPAGRVLLCDVLDEVLCEINGRSINEIWALQQLHPLTKLIETLPLKCKGCKLAGLCRGGCFARAYLTYNSLVQPDPLCPRINSNFS